MKEEKYALTTFILIVVGVLIVYLLEKTGTIDILISYFEM